MAKRKYPELYEAVCKRVDWEIENWGINPNRRQACINTTYTNCCSAINKGLLTAEEALEGYTTE